MFVGAGGDDNGGEGEELPELVAEALADVPLTGVDVGDADELGGATTVPPTGTTVRKSTKKGESPVALVVLAISWWADAESWLDWKSSKPSPSKVKGGAVNTTVGSLSMVKRMMGGGTPAFVLTVPYTEIWIPVRDRVSVSKA